MEKNNVGDQSESESASDHDMMMPSKYITEADTDAAQTDSDDYANDQTKALVPSSSNGRQVSKIFSNEVEIALLKGVDDYITKESIGFKEINWGEFHVFISTKIKKLTTIKYNKNQIYEKVRSFKKKYKESKGIDPSVNAHASYLWELSNKLWEEERIINDILPKKRGNEITEDDLMNDYPFLVGSFEEDKEDRVREKCHLIGRKKARKLEFKFAELGTFKCEIKAKDVEFRRLDCELHVLLYGLHD